MYAQKLLALPCQLILPQLTECLLEPDRYGIIPLLLHDLSQLDGLVECLVQLVAFDLVDI